MLKRLPADCLDIAGPWIPQTMSLPPSVSGVWFFPRTGAGQDRAGLTAVFETMVVSDGANRCSSTPPHPPAPPFPVTVSLALSFAHGPPCAGTRHHCALSRRHQFLRRRHCTHTARPIHTLCIGIACRHRHGVIPGESRPKRGAPPHTQPIIPLGEDDRDQWLPSGGEDQAAVPVPCTSIFA